jgi:hypothetical protein
MPEFHPGTWPPAFALDPRVASLIRVLMVIGIAVVLATLASDAAMVFHVIF